MLDPIAFMARYDQYKMYFDQSMRQPDKDRFIKAMVKEINDHTERKH